MGPRQERPICSLSRVYGRIVTYQSIPSARLLNPLSPGIKTGCRGTRPRLPNEAMHPGRPASPALPAAPPHMSPHLRLLPGGRSFNLAPSGPIDRHRGWEGLTSLSQIQTPSSGDLGAASALVPAQRLLKAKSSGCHDGDRTQEGRN